MAYNKCILIGNIVRDPELRVTQKGMSVCSFTIAVKRRMQDVTDFHDCVAWGKNGEAISKNFHKGKEILVEGELQKRNFEDKQGNKRWTTEVNVGSFSFVGRKEDDRNANPPGGFDQFDDSDDLPF